MILVVGSTGFLGSEICRRLVGRGQAVRGLVRATSNPERVAALKALGVTTMLGDLQQSETLAAACQGVATVISTASTTISMQPTDSIPATDQQGQLNLVQAARDAGVSQFIYVSYSKKIEPGPNPCPLTVAKRCVEQAVIASGMTYTILRPCDFMEAWLSPMVGFDYPNAKANVFGDGHARISYISLGDVAQYAVESLDNPAARNAIFELGGPAALSQLEAVRIFEQASGKQFELQFVPVAALQAQREAATDPLQKSFASLMLQQVAGIEVDSGAAQQAFGLTLGTVEDYARRVTG
jgi:NADH dehydrogenase